MIETARLTLRPWAVADAVLQRELWTERDPRVPPHRRIDADGHPTVAELEERIRSTPPDDRAFMRVIVLRETGEAVGYCGILASPSAPAGEPELAYELLRRHWGHGYATEAAGAMIDVARAKGHRRLWATVWDWNTASRRVLAKVGFVETDRVELDTPKGRSITARLDL